jgi:hypothetical protein
MAKSRSFSTLCWLLVGSLVAAAASNPLMAQGEDSETESSSPAERTGMIGGVMQRFFAPKEPAAAPTSSTSEAKKGTVRTSDRGFKPGVFQGGMVKQFKAMVDPNQGSEVNVERTQTPSASSNQPSNNTASVPKAPSQFVPRAPSREPFSKPLPPIVSPNQQTQNQTSNTARDVFAEDPPSLVGTGVSGKATNGTRQANEVNSNRVPPMPNSISQRSSPMDSEKSSSDSLSLPSESEAPKISRKAVPVANNESTRPKTTSAQTTYAIPGNPYTAPPKSANAVTNNSDPNRYSGINPTAPPLSSAPVSAQPFNRNNSPSPNESKPTARSAGPATTPNPYTTPNSVPSSSSTSVASTPNATRGETRAEMSIPKVKLFVSGPPSLQVGRAIPYEVQVRNEGAEMLSGVIVSMVVPASVKTSMPVANGGEHESEKDAQGVETLLWHVTDLAPSQARVFRISLEATKAEHFAVDVEWTVLPQTGKVQVAVQQPQLNLGIEGPAKVMWGKPEIYRLRVRNPGNADVKDVQLKLAAESYGSNQSKIGDIPAGSEKIVEVELTFQQSGTIKLAGQAESATQQLEASSTIEVGVEQVELTTQWEGPAEQYQGGIAEYRFTVFNRSQYVAEGVNCVAKIPAQFKVVSLPPGASLHSDEIRWVIPRLEPNTPAAFDVSLQALEMGEAKIATEVACNGGGKANTETLVNIDSISDLKLTVTDPVAPAPVGQDVIYDLTIVNRGSKAAKSVQLLAQFSNGIEPVRAEGNPSRVLPGQVVFESIPVIEPGQEITLRVVAQASEPGMHRFRAELQCEADDTQLVEEESTRYLATTKSDTKSGTLRR